MVTLSIKVIPKSRSNSIIGKRNNEWVIKLTAPADKGKANKQLIGYLAEVTDQPKQNIEIVSGETSRHKNITFHGLDIKEVESILSENV
ncbi:MAG: DUF167 domain-containing protein [Patescibacteria group bacterium]